MIVGVDAGGMTVRKGDLNSVVADLAGGLRGGLGLEHGKRRELRAGGGGQMLFLVALFVACGARTMIAKIDEIKMALVAVRPCNVHAGSGRHMNLDGSWLATWVDGKRHEI